MATEVGTAYATIIPSAKGFARNLRKEVAKEFAGSDLDRMVADALGDTRVKLNVEPVVDTSRLRDVAGRPVRLPVEVNEHEAAAEVADAARHAERTAPRVRLQVDVDADSTRSVGRASSLASTLLGGLTASASTMVGVVSNATSSLAGLATGLLAAGAAATFIVPGVYLAGGAIGSLPGIIAGAVAAFGALSLGMMGIADHFKEVGGSGGGAGVNLAAQARQVAQATRGVETAERSLARAQREVVLAQQAVTRAREAEAERLQDLNRSVSRARLDEEDAVLRVREAELDLAEARRSGNRLDRDRAELAYQQALLGVEEAKDATEDLVAEQEKSTKVGVEGSEQVQEALRRQQDAIEGVTAAQEQLLSAQEALQAAQEKPPSGGGGAAQELMRLAPAAQAFVNQVKALKPAFERLRLNVQQKLFAGLDKSVRGLATAWFPQLNKTLGDYASTFNGLAKRAADSLSQKSFIDNIAAGAESARTALERIGRAVTGPLVDAFGRLSRAAGPFIETLGDEVADLVEDFSAWIEQLDESGKLEEFFGRASEVLRDVFNIGRDLASIFGSVMSILFGQPDVSQTPWVSFRDFIHDVSEWLKNPENQQKVNDFINSVKNFLTRDLPEAIGKAKSVIDTIDGWLDTVERWRQRIEGFRDAVVIAFGVVNGALRSVTSPITTALQQFTRLQQGVAREVGRIGSTMGGIPGMIVRGLGNTGTLLYQAGRNVISGLISGIRSRFGGSNGLGAAIGAAASLIRSYLPFSPAKQGPLSGSGNPYYSGRSIVRLLSSGITDTLGTAESAASDLAGTFALSGGPFAAGGSLGMSTPAPAPLVAQWVGGDGDPIVRAIREHTRIYYGGSAQAAFGS
ncbi:hypothetical protein AB0J20_16260 [Micromonospora costi]|uniref:hypothetical protein n=1 Tax=Micromonospora costi TaxID=1530042 RepID=UPI0033DDE365